MNKSELKQLIREEIQKEMKTGRRKPTEVVDGLNLGMTYHQSQPIKDLGFKLTDDEGVEPGDIIWSEDDGVLMRIKHPYTAEEFKKTMLWKVVKDTSLDEGRFSSESNADFDEQRKLVTDLFAHLDKLNTAIKHPHFAMSYTTSMQDRLIEKSVELEDKLMGILDSLNNNSPLANTQIHTLRNAIIDGFEQRD